MHKECFKNNIWSNIITALSLLNMIKMRIIQYTTVQIENPLNKKDLK
jgi:hypothetical protein